VWGILSDYIPADISMKLKEHLKIEDDSPIDTIGGPPVKCEKLSEPTENYALSNGKSKTNAQPLSTKQVQLQKASRGSQSLNAFFGKK
jgi:hypothetical protein